MTMPTIKSLRAHAISHSLFRPTTLKSAVERLKFVQADLIRSPARAQDLMVGSESRITGQATWNGNTQFSILKKMFYTPTVFFPVIFGNCRILERRLICPNLSEKSLRQSRNSARFIERIGSALRTRTGCQCPGRLFKSDDARSGKFTLSRASPNYPSRRRNSRL